MCSVRQELRISRMRKLPPRPTLDAWRAHRSLERLTGTETTTEQEAEAPLDDLEAGEEPEDEASLGNGGRSGRISTSAD